jgi:S-adenosylmethionine:tRNA ribosyltransferase-isomerase
MPHLDIRDYQYDLPSERIPLYPLTERDQSKLLVYHKGTIMHTRFAQITGYFPENTLLFFNNTKVIPARLRFEKSTGAEIEIFLLTPVHPSTLLAATMQSTEICTWQCTIGNLKRWKENVVLVKTIEDSKLEAELIDREEGLVSFRWTNGKSFAEILNLSGITPLPPYLKRPAEISDRHRYQTIYSQHDGAVAAPTAGLHFTQRVFETLNEKNILHDFLTLHVSAGTFQPVKTENAEDHTMHHEQLIVTRQNIENLNKSGSFVIPVGTTSMRTLESIYWFGVKLLQDKNAAFVIDQNDPYRQAGNASPAEAIAAVKKYMDDRGLETVAGQTSIFIKPGYRFRICKGLVTNFHQPASTLILLVASFIGNDWKRVYDEALKNDYRFLSFGDSSLLIP